MTDFLPVGVSAVVENVDGFIGDINRMTAAVRQFTALAGREAVDLSTSRAAAAGSRATERGASAARAQQAATVGAAAASSRLADSANDTAQATERAASNTRDLAQATERARRTQADMSKAELRAADAAREAEERRSNLLAQRQREVNAIVARERLSGAGTLNTVETSGLAESARRAQENLRVLRREASETNAEIRRIGSSAASANRLSEALHSSAAAANDLASQTRVAVTAILQAQRAGGSLRGVLTGAFSLAGRGVSDVASRIRVIGGAMNALSGPLKAQRNTLSELNNMLSQLSRRYDQLRGQASRAAAAHGALAQEASQLSAAYERLGRSIDQVENEISEMQRAADRADVGELGDTRSSTQWQNAMNGLLSTLSSLQTQQQNVGARMQGVNQAMANTAAATTAARGAMGNLQGVMAGVGLAIGNTSRIIGVLSKALGALAVVGFAIVGAMKGAQFAISALGGAARFVSSAISGIGNAFGSGFRAIGAAIALPHRLLQGFGDVLGKISTSIERQANNWFKYGNSLRFFGQSLLFVVTLPIVGFLGALTKEAIAFEEAWAGLVKTVNDTNFKIVTEGALNVNDLTALGENLQKVFRQLALEIPLPTVELLKLGQVAGQLGIRGVANLRAFASVAAQLGVTTNIAAEDAASGLARLIAVAGGARGAVSDVELELAGFSAAQIGAMSESDRFQQTVRILGSVLVHLGNNVAATESEILKLAEKIAAAGSVIGNFTATQIIGIAGAFRAAGIAAEKGGTAFTKILFNIGEAVLTGNEHLAVFAKTAGFVGDELGTAGEKFADAWRTEPIEAFRRFVEGLAVQGEKAINTFIGVEEESARLREAFLSVAQSGLLTKIFTDEGTRGFGLLAEAIAGTSDELNALEIEAALRFSTTQSQLQLLKNAFTELGVTVGTYVLPQVNRLARFLVLLATIVGDLSPGVQQVAIAFALVAAAVGPAVIGLGLFLSSLGFIVQFIGSVIGGIGLLFSVFGGITIPILAVVAAIAGLGIAAIASIEHATRMRREWLATVSSLVIASSGVTEATNGLAESTGRAGGLMGVLGESTRVTTENMVALKASQQGVAESSGVAGGLMGTLAGQVQRTGEQARETSGQLGGLVGNMTSGFRDMSEAAREATGRAGGLMGSLTDGADDAAEAVSRVTAELERAADATGEFGTRVGGLSGQVVKAVGSMVRAPDRQLRQFAKRMFEYGHNVVLSFARGMAAAIGAILKVIAAIGRVIARFLRPGSPPKLLPDLDEWGRQAMLSWMEGWESADFDIFNKIADRIETIIRSTTPDGGPDMIERIFASREVIAEIIDEIGRFGRVTEEQMQRIFEAMGGVSENTAVYIRRLFELNVATQNVARAQEDLNRITKRYEQALIPLERRLAAISARQREVQNQARIAELEMILGDVSSSPLAKELAGLELEQIEIEGDVSVLKSKQDIETQLAEARLEAAKAEEQAAQELLAAAEALLEVQDENNDLWRELLDMLEEVGDALKEAAEKLEEAAEGVGDALADIAEGFSEDLGEGLDDVDLGDLFDLDEETNELADQINARFRKIFRDIRQEFKPLLLLWDEVGRVWLPIVEKIVLKIEEMLPSIDSIETSISNFETAATNFATKLETDLLPVFADFLRILEDLGLIDASWREAFDPKELEGMTGELWTHYQRIKEIVTGIQDFIAPYAERAAAWAKDFATGFSSGFSEGLAEAPPLNELLTEFVNTGLTPELAGKAIGSFITTIKTKIQEGFDALKSTDFGTILDGVLTSLGNAKDTLEQIGRGIVAAFLGISDQLEKDSTAAKIADILTSLGDAITLFLAPARLLGEFAQGALAGFFTVISLIGENENFQKSIDTIREAFGSISDSISRFVGVLESTGAMDMLARFASMVGALTGVLLGLMAAGAINIIAYMTSRIAELAAVVTDMFLSALGTLVTLLTDAATASATFVTEALENIDALKSGANEAIEVFGGELTEKAGVLWDTFVVSPLTAATTFATNVSAMLQAGVDAAVAFVSSFFTAGADIVQGLIDGFLSVGAGDIVAGESQGILDLVKGIFGISSPSTVFFGFGLNVMLGFQQGLQQNMTLVLAVMTALTTQLLAIITAWVTQIQMQFTLLMEAISLAIADGQETILESFEEIIEEVLRMWEEDFMEPLIGPGGVFEEIIDAIELMFEDMVDEIKKQIDDAIQYVLRRLVEMIEAIRAFRDELEDAATEMMDGLLSGVKAVGAEVAAEAIAIANSIRDAFKDALDMILAVQEAAEEAGGGGTGPGGGGGGGNNTANAPVPGPDAGASGAPPAWVPPWMLSPVPPPPVVMPAEVIVNQQTAPPGPVINMGGQTINNGIDGHRLVLFIENALADAIRYRTR